MLAAGLGDVATGSRKENAVFVRTRMKRAGIFCGAGSLSPCPVKRKKNVVGSQVGPRGTEGREKPLYLEGGDSVHEKKWRLSLVHVLLPDASSTVGLGRRPKLPRVGRATHLPFLGTLAGRSWEGSSNQ